MTKRLICCDCGVINRVPSYRINEIPRCGTCGKRLAEPTVVKAFREAYRHRRWAIPVVIVLLVLEVNWPFRPETTVPPITAPSAPAPPDKAPVPSIPTQNSVANQPPVSAAPPPSCVDRPQPLQGLYRSYDTTQPLAPLTIQTTAGSNYFVKLEDAASGWEVMSFFVHGGTTLNAEVPFGNFVLKYATGDFWCGGADLFGRDTATFKAEDTFTFKPTEDGVTGWTVELIQQPGGNLQTTPIPRSQF